MQTIQNQEFPMLEGTTEQIQSMRDVMYELYKMDWMASHNHTLDEYVEEIKQIAIDLSAENNSSFEDVIEDTFFTFEYERGFGGEIWACYNEFLESEYMDEEYINGLIDRLSSSMINAELRYLYQKDISNLEYEGLMYQAGEYERE